MRYCSNCGEIVSNPQINLSCAKWCKMAKECLGDLPEEAIAASPVIERLKALLHKRLAAAPDRMQNALDTLLKAETMMMKEEGDPSLVKPSSLFAGALLTPAGDVDDGADTTMGDATAWDAMLEQSGMETPGSRHAIVALAQAAVAGNWQENGDFAIVWDATQLQKLKIMARQFPNVTETKAVMDSIRTDSGRRMAEQFQTER